MGELVVDTTQLSLGASLVHVAAGHLRLHVDELRSTSGSLTFSLVQSSAAGAWSGLAMHAAATVAGESTAVDSLGNALDVAAQTYGTSEASLADSMLSSMPL